MPVLAAIEISGDPDRNPYIRVLTPDATGVRVLSARLIQDYDEALALVKATYPTAQIVTPHELSQEVERRQPPAQPIPVVADDLMDIEF